MAKKKPTSSYWEKRFELLQNEALRPADEYLLDLGEIYERTAQEIEQKMLYWTKRFADNNDLSMAEAKKILEAGELKEFHWTLEEYAKKAAKGSAWAKEVENASTRVHLSRLEAMRLDLKGVVESAVPEDLKWLFEEVYERAYYGAGHEIARGFGTTFPMQKIDDKALDRVMRKPWTTDARTFSDRLWENKAKLIAELQDTLARGLILGTSQDKLIREMRDKMGTSYANARRIVRTESAFFSAAGDRDAYDSLGVKKFQILATLDTRTSEICQEMDQKIFDFKDYEIGITAPPFHPNCRSTTVPYFDDMAEIEERAAREVDGRTVMVRGDMGYQEWHEHFVESNPEYAFKERAWKNRFGDRKQFDKYRDLLGDAIPNRFEDFQRLKYNSADEWERLKLLFKDENLKKEIRTEYNLKIHEGRQGKHILGHNNYDGKSYLAEGVDPRVLVNLYAGTGEIRRNDATGKWYGKQFFTHTSIVGYVEEDGHWYATRYFSIEYSKANGVHIVPRIDRRLR